MSRLAVALLAATPGAVLGGLASIALGLHHLWPGVIAAYVFGVPFFLIVDRRLSR